MNIVAQYPNFTPLNLNIQVEAAQHDASQREIVPPLVRSDVSPNNHDAANSKDSKYSGNYSSATLEEQDEDVVYDYANITRRNKEQQEQEQGNGDNQTSPENDKKPNGELLTNSEQKEVQQLKSRDEEVRIHERQHQMAGGRYASSPSYTTELGPDGKEYAVGGEVQISTSEEDTPEKTVTKMRQVRRAAMAPAEPSSQDYAVAREAKQKELKAQQEIREERNSSNDSEASTQVDRDVNKDNSAAQKDGKLDTSSAGSSLGKLSFKFRDVISSRYANSWHASSSSVSAYA
ncbi:MAG: hypothetical protein IJ078_11830 [Succinivibrionaceae bacterium]|nr:hypothetical protein [Succinivibrionaceae bacterium]